MDVFHLSANLIQVRFLVVECLLEGPVVLLNEAGESLLVD